MPNSYYRKLIISDTSCLIALTNIGRLDLLKDLCKVVYITPEVAMTGTWVRTPFFIYIFLLYHYNVLVYVYILFPNAPLWYIFFYYFFYKVLFQSLYF